MSASRRQRLKPVELVVMAAVAAVFVGVIVLMATREIELASIFLGIAFIGTLLLLAMFALVEGPDRPADQSDTPVLMRERPERRKDRH